jgi:(p)ppGpp synthase/HD superfamily hydrolase
MSDLGTAIAIAAQAFKGKVDKGGKPYILHCLHVMNKMKYENDEELMIIAVLHDLVEDTPYTFTDLEIMGFSTRVINNLVLLTHKKGVSYEDYIFQIKSNSECAVKVKLQDLRHNSDITRMKGLRDKDFKRIEKYHKAYSYLMNGD